MGTATSYNSDTCSICTETFTEPKFLPCYHTFCLNCLQALVSSTSNCDEFFCPLCRHRVTLPEEGVTGFQTNVYVEARVQKQIHGTGECCRVCDQPACRMCRECDMLLCDACTQTHGIFPATRSHLLINLDDPDLKKPVLSVQRFCEKHVTEQLRFYCERCCEAICRDCKLTHHDGHTTVDLSDVVKEARTSLVKIKVKLEDYKTKTQESLKHVFRNTTKMAELAEKEQKEINTFADSVVEIIDMLRCQQIDRVIEKDKTSRNKLSDQQTSLQQRLCFIQSQIDHADAMLEQGMECDVIITDSEMKRRLTEIQSNQSMVSDLNSHPVLIAPNTAAHLSHLEVIRCALNDFRTNSFPEKNSLSVKVETTECDALGIDFICLANSQKVLIVESLTSNLCLFEKSSSKPTWKFEVKMDELIKDGVKGVIEIHNDENPENKIPVDDYTDLKKPFPYVDVNDDGDTCGVVNHFNLVVVKPVNGVVRTLTFNPLAERDQFNPVDVCWGKNKQVYIVDSLENVIIVYSLQDGFQTSFKIPSECSLTAVAVDKEGKLWVGDWRGNIHVCTVE